MTIVNRHLSLLWVCALFLLTTSACTAELWPVVYREPVVHHKTIVYEEPVVYEEYDEEPEYPEVFIEVNNVWVVHPYHEGCTHHIYYHRHNHYYPASHPEIRHRHRPRHHSSPKRYNKHQSLKSHPHPQKDHSKSVESPAKHHDVNKHTSYDCKDPNTKNDRCHPKKQKHSPKPKKSHEPQPHKPEKQNGEPQSDEPVKEKQKGTAKQKSNQKKVLKSQPQ